MKCFILFSLLLSALTLEAAPVKLLSPDTAQTFAIAWLVDHQFTWNARTKQFCADLRFSERSATKWSAEESFRFVFPEVKFDETNRTFYVAIGQEQPVPIAQLRKGWLGPSIVPAPGTSVLVANEGGKVRLILTADSNPQHRPASVWIERSDAWVLQNLVPAITGSN